MSDMLSNWTDTVQMKKKKIHSYTWKWDKNTHISVQILRPWLSHSWMPRTKSTFRQPHRALTTPPHHRSINEPTFHYAFCDALLENDRWQMVLFFPPNQVWKNYKGFAFDHKVGRDVPTWGPYVTPMLRCTRSGKSTSGDERDVIFFFWIREGRDWWCFPFPSPISI